MKHEYLFKFGGTDTISRFFSAPVHVVAFGLKPASYTTKQVITDDGREFDVLDTLEDCDFVTFERVLVDDVYDISACEGIQEQGVIASLPLRKPCCGGGFGDVLRLDHCNPEAVLESPGIYRAIYHGTAREEAAVVFYPLKR